MREYIHVNFSKIIRHISVTCCKCYKFPNSICISTHLNTLLEREGDEQQFELSLHNLCDHDIMTSQTMMLMVTVAVTGGDNPTSRCVCVCVCSLPVTAACNTKLYRIQFIHMGRQKIKLVIDNNQ